MKTKPLLFVIAGLGALAATGYGLYALGLRQGRDMGRVHADAPVATAGPAGSASGAASAAERKVLYWHDPMVPGPRFDKPGKSPFMEMPLVPVYADEGVKDGGVSVDPRTQQNLGVRTAEVTSGTLRPTLQAVGSVAWNERDVAVVPARATGIVDKLFVRAPLDPVAKGQVLAELYVPDWVAAQEEFLAVRRLAGRPGSQGPADLVDAARQRLRLAGMNDQQVEKVESAGVVQARIGVTAPIGGVLAEINVREGSSVTTGMQIARINGLSTVWLNAELPEALVTRIRVGEEVEARTSAGVGATGKVAALLPEVNPTTRTLKVRIELPNRDRQLVPGMFATLRIKPPARRDVLLIPSEALIATGTRSVVMVAQDDGRFMPVEVEAGIESDGQTEITKGLKAGQRVVLSGQFLLDSEASLKGVENRQGATSGARP